jgi:hypothetical protein
MPIAVEELDKPSILLETLAGELPDARVNYECRGQEHRFCVARDGKQFTLQLPARVLSHKDLRELEEVAVHVARQVRAYVG